MEKNINTFYLLHLRLPAISRYRGCHEKGLLGTEVAVHQRNGSRDRDRGVYRTTQAPGWNPTDYLAVCVKAKHMPIFHGDFFLLVHMCAGWLKAAYPYAHVILWETRRALSRWLKFNMTLSFDHTDMVPKGNQSLAQDHLTSLNFKAEAFTIMFNSICSTNTPFSLFWNCGIILQKGYVN